MTYQYRTDRPSRRERLAARHRSNERMETLLRMRERDPVAFTQATDSSTRISLGLYVSSKQAWEAEQAIKEGTDA